MPPSTTKIGKRLALDPSETSLQSLAHAGEIVPTPWLPESCSVDMPDFCRLTALEDDPARDGERPLQIRDVVALDSPGQIGEAELVTQFLERRVHALSRLEAADQSQLGVLRSHLHQLASGTSLRSPNRDAPSGALGKERLQRPGVLDLRSTQEASAGTWRSASPP